MGLTRLAVDRPLVVAMAIAALLLLGLRAWFQLPTELDPRVSIPSLTITVTLPGAGPSEVERRVTRPIEDAVSTISHVNGIHSTSQENVSFVSVDFQFGTNLDTALADVRARLDAVRADLPPDASVPVTSKLDLSAQPVMVLGLTGRPSLAELRRLAVERIKPALSQVPGVASVQVVGGEDQEVQVLLDPARLDAAGLTQADVIASLRVASLGAPAGTVAGEGREFSVRAQGEFRSLEDIRRTPLSARGTAASGAGDLTAGRRLTAPLTLQEIASVGYGSTERETITLVNARDSIGLIVTRAPDANTVAVADGLRRALDGMEGRSAGRAGAGHERTWRVDGNVEITALRDQSTAVADALEDINGALILGSLLAVGVVWLFLRSIRDTVIIALAIPCSLIPTFLVMYFGNFTLNQMTMLGLALSIGILVDDSILVLESIHRHRAMGKSPREAALDGRAEIGLADAANTFVDVVVFVPIAFMGGIVGQFFRQFGLTVATATLLSLYVSFSVTPMLAAHWGGADVSDTPPARHRTGGWHPLVPTGWVSGIWPRLETGYGKALDWALRRRALVVTLGFASLGVAMALAALVVGVDFVPPTDRGQVNAAIELPAGSPLSETEAVARRVDAAAATIPEVRARLASVGEIPPGFGALPRRGSELGQVALTLHDKVGLVDRLLRPGRAAGRRRSDEEVAADLRTRLGRLPGARVTVSAVRAWSGGSAPLQVELVGSNLDQLSETARRVEAAIARVPGVRHPDVSLRTGRPELRVELDRSQAVQAGVSAAQVVTGLRDAIQGNTEVKYRWEEQTYDVRVRIAGLRDAGPGALERLTVAQTAGAPLSLGEVASLRQDVGPTEIQRKDRRRVVTVTAELAPGYSLGNVQRAASRALERLTPAGVELRWAGEVDEMANSARLLVAALLLAAALAYMLMAALFNSLVHPLTILLCLPMALVGAIGALALAGETLNIVSMIGIIMLVGLVSKNAILLVDYTNTLRSRGLERDEAVRQAGPVRLRPIVMTTLCTVLAMLPVALRIGRAAEMRAPMAVAVIGGLILSTLLTLLVVPVVYTLFDDLQQRLWRGKREPLRLSPGEE